MHGGHSDWRGVGGELTQIRKWKIQSNICLTPCVMEASGNIQTQSNSSLTIYNIPGQTNRENTHCVSLSASIIQSQIDNRITVKNLYFLFMLQTLWLKQYTHFKNYHLMIETAHSHQCLFISCASSSMFSTFTLCLRVGVSAQRGAHCHRRKRKGVLWTHIHAFKTSPEP